MPPRFVVRRSTIHGRGVFATTLIRAGDYLLDYEGDVITDEEAFQRSELSPDGHTMLFDLGDGYVVDGASNGNSARWINHSCEPNVAAETRGHRVMISALRDIKPGEELLLDYQLQLGSEADDDAAASYACRCGATDCRQTMLAS